MTPRSNVELAGRAPPNASNSVSCFCFFRSSPAPFSLLLHSPMRSPVSGLEASLLIVPLLLYSSPLAPYNTHRDPFELSTH